MMNYKETVLFIGKCLTINHEIENKKIIAQELKKMQEKDWDNIVRISTSHLVFCALYINLKEANFLELLPNDLVEYMEHINSLNRKRNKKIIKQAKDINTLLTTDNIHPIFLKGTAYILQGLYTDISERMIGDIDFLVQESEISKTVKLLKDNGYYEKVKKLPKSYSRHYPRLNHDTEIAAVEVHREILRDQYSKILNYKNIKPKSFINKSDVLSMSNEQAFMYTIFANQINDYGYWYNTFSLRTIYDTFLISKHIKENKVTNSHVLNDNISLYSKILNTKSSLLFEETKSSKRFIEKAFKPNKLKNKFISLYILTKKSLYMGIRFTNKEYRAYILSKLY